MFWRKRAIPKILGSTSVFCRKSPARAESVALCIPSIRNSQFDRSARRIGPSEANIIAFLRCEAAKLPAVGARYRPTPNILKIVFTIGAISSRPSLFACPSRCCGREGTGAVVFQNPHTLPPSLLVGRPFSIFRRWAILLSIRSPSPNSRRWEAAAALSIRAPRKGLMRVATMQQWKYRRWKSDVLTGIGAPRRAGEDGTEYCSR
jgi:hypothetical protein